MIPGPTWIWLSKLQCGKKNVVLSSRGTCTKIDI